MKNVPGQLSNPDDLAKIIGGLGIDNDTHVVISHNGKNALAMGSATRIYWTFKVLGHDQVSILNGGYRGYASDPGNEIEKGNNKPEPKTFTVSLRPEMIATKVDVKMAINDDSTALVDIRPTHQFLGINRHPKSKRFGTIPSAKSFPESWGDRQWRRLLPQCCRPETTVCLGRSGNRRETDQLLQYRTLGLAGMVCFPRTDRQQGSDPV